MLTYYILAGVITLITIIYLGLPDTEEESVVLFLKGLSGAVAWPVVWAVGVLGFICSLAGMLIDKIREQDEEK
jgi:hypothetical protein